MRHWTLEAAAGLTLEKIMIQELQERYAVIPLCKISTDGPYGPRFEGGGISAILPDLQFYGPRRYGWLDAKAKSQSNYRKDRNRLEQGIDYDAFQDYFKVQRESKMPVYLLFIEMDSQELLMTDLNTLRSAGQPRLGDWGDGKRSINWNRGVLSKVGTFVVPNGDLIETEVTWDWDSLGSFLSQLELEGLDG